MVGQIFIAVRPRSKYNLSEISIFGDYMTNHLKKYQSILTNWLLYLTLIWSVFLFSGYVDSEFLSLPTATNTELVEEKKITASTFIFHKNLAQSKILASPLLFINAFKATLIAFNQLQQVKLITALKKAKLYVLSLIHLPIKIIPLNTKEIFPPLVLS